MMRLEQERGYLKIFRDPTAEHEAESALRASEAHLRAALEIETVGAIYFDMKGTLTVGNDPFLALAGYSCKELQAGLLTWQKMTPPEWLADSERAFAELKSTGRTIPYEKEYCRRDGTRWWGFGLCSYRGAHERLRAHLGGLQPPPEHPVPRTSAGSLTTFGEWKPLSGCCSWSGGGLL